MRHCPPLRIALFLLFFSSTLFSQEFETQNLKTIYESHFDHYREAVHLHLNKTLFFQGEEIWWSAYVYNRKSNQSSNPTKNLYCGLYDSKGELIRKELFLVEKGTSHGSFKIDSTWTPGTYYIKANTAWMKNFKEDEPFVQKITIVDNNSEIESVPNQKKYDLQLLPEGGHLISEVDNMVGMRIVDGNGKGIQIQKGGIYDNQNNRVTEVFTNDVGIGRFKFLPKENVTYTLKGILKDGKAVEKVVPEAKSEGIAMAVNNILEDKVVVSLNTNSRTLEEIKRDSFHLAIHRDGIMTLNSFVMENTSRNIKIDKKTLLPGTNIITLFNQDLEPICERLIFNYQGAKITNASLTKQTSKKDSILLKLKTVAKKTSPMSLSVSTLPASSISNYPDNTILSSFLLRPYLKSHIENASRYFSEIDRTKEYELDLALATQGWSSYDWTHIFKGKPEISFPFEFGIEAEVTLNSILRKDERLALVQDGIGSMVFLDMEDSTSVKLTELFSKNGDLLKFSIRKKRGGLKKPDLSVKYASFISGEDSFIPPFFSQNNGPFSQSFQESVTESLANLVEPSNTISLDEVVVVEDKVEKKLTRKHPLVNSLFKGVKIGEEEIKKSQLLTDFIARNGFRVFFNPRGTGGLAIASGVPGRGPVKIYDNDVQLFDLRPLIGVPLTDIDEIYLQTQGFGEVNAPGGIIRIYRKEGRSLSVNRSSSFAEKLVENGFSRPKDFYRPKYASTESDAFSSFGIVHWEPKLTTNKKGEITFKIPKDKIPVVKVFVEGMGEDGSLLSYTQEITLD